MNHSYSKRDCICGDYKPYRPKGVHAAMMPRDACMNCYQEVMKEKTQKMIEDSEKPNEYKSDWLP